MEKSESKTDDREKGGDEDRGQRGKGGKGQGQRKEKQYEDGERDQSMPGERKIKGIFYGRAQKRKKGGIKEIIKFKESEERWKDKKD